MNKAVIVILAVIILAVLGYFLFRGTPETVPLKEGPIVAFDDSLVVGYGATEGNDFVSLLSERVGKPITNLGVSGDTTAKALLRIDEVLEEKPSVVIILLGGNDYLRKVPIEDTFANLSTIVDQIEASGARVLLLGVRGGLLRDIFEERFEQFAKEKKVTFVPNVLDGLIGDDRYMSDSIHPNDAGYEKIADKVEPILKDMLK